MLYEFCNWQIRESIFNWWSLCQTAMSVLEFRYSGEESGMKCLFTIKIRYEMSHVPIELSQASYFFIWSSRYVCSELTFNRKNNRKQRVLTPNRLFSIHLNRSYKFSPHIFVYLLLIFNDGVWEWILADIAMLANQAIICLSYIPKYIAKFFEVLPFFQLYPLRLCQP